MGCWDSPPRKDTTSSSHQDVSKSATTFNCSRPHSGAEPWAGGSHRVSPRHTPVWEQAAGAGGSTRTAAETRCCAGTKFEKENTPRTEVNAGEEVTKPGRQRPEPHAARTQEPPPSAATKLSATDTRRHDWPAAGRHGSQRCAEPRAPVPHGGRVLAARPRAPQPAAPPDQAAVALRPTGGRDLGPSLDLQHLACKPEPTCVLPPAWRLPSGRPSHGHTHRGCLPAGRRAATCRGARKECYSEVGKDSCW